MVHGLVPSTLDAGCMQCSHMQMHAKKPNPKISGNKVRDASESINQGKRSTALDYTVSLYVVSPPACSQNGFGQQEAMLYWLNVM